MSREAVKLLSEKYDRVFIHSGGGAEAEFAREMERTYANVTALNGILKDLGSEMDLISNLDCVVSMDSLVMHLASLVANTCRVGMGRHAPRTRIPGIRLRPRRACCRWRCAADRAQRMGIRSASSVITGAYVP